MLVDKTNEESKLDKETKQKNFKEIENWEKGVGK